MFRLVIFPVSTMLTVTYAVREILARIQNDGTSIVATDRLLPPGEVLGFIGLPEIRKLEERFATKRSNALSGGLSTLSGGSSGEETRGAFSAKAASLAW